MVGGSAGTDRCGRRDGKAAGPQRRDVVKQLPQIVFRQPVGPAVGGNNAVQGVHAAQQHVHGVARQSDGALLSGDETVFHGVGDLHGRLDADDAGGPLDRVGGGASAPPAASAGWGPSPVPAVLRSGQGGARRFPRGTGPATRGRASTWRARAPRFRAGTWSGAWRARAGTPRPYRGCSAGEETSPHPKTEISVTPVQAGRPAKTTAETIL